MNAKIPATVDTRPAVAVGHIGPVEVQSLDEALAFYRSLGMRTVGQFGAMAILELRGGTHLILRRGRSSRQRVPFDLMVDDIDAIHRDLASRGLNPGPIRRGGIHSTFEVLDPEGHQVSITSSHAIGPV